MAAAVCRACGVTLVITTTRGRNRRYCSTRCLRSAERERIDDLSEAEIERRFEIARKRCRAGNRFTVDPWENGGGGYGVA